jgi:hypothetical protein
MPEKSDCPSRFSVPTEMLSSVSHGLTEGEAHGSLSHQVVHFVRLHAHERLQHTARSVMVCVEPDAVADAEPASLSNLETCALRVVLCTS